MSETEPTREQMEDAVEEARARAEWVFRCAMDYALRAGHSAGRKEAEEELSSALAKAEQELALLNETLRVTNAMGSELKGRIERLEGAVKP